MGVASEVLSLQKGGGAEKVLAMLKGGGGTNSFEAVLTWEVEVLAILMGGGRRKKFPQGVLKGGGRGAGNKFWTRDFPIL